MRNITDTTPKPVNRIKTLLHVYAETKGIEYDEAVLQFLTDFNVSRQQLSWWENNSSQPDDILKPHIAKFFNRPIDKVFTIK